MCSDNMLVNLNFENGSEGFARSPCQLDCGSTVIKAKKGPYQILRNSDISVNISKILHITHIATNNLICNKK